MEEKNSVLIIYIHTYINTCCHEIGDKGQGGRRLGKQKGLIEIKRSRKQTRLQGVKNKKVSTRNDMGRQEEQHH